MAEHLSVPVSMDLVTAITTGGKGSTIPNTLNFLLPFLSLSSTCLIILITEVQRFVYYGTSQDCEGVVSSLLYWSPCTNGVRIIVLSQFSQVMAEKKITPFGSTGVDKQSNCNCRFKVLFTNDPRSSSPQSSAETGARLGSGIRNQVGRLKYTSK